MIRLCGWCKPKRLLTDSGDAGEVYEPSPEQYQNEEVTDGICNECMRLVLEEL